VYECSMVWVGGWVAGVGLVVCVSVSVSVYVLLSEVSLGLYTYEERNMCTYYMYNTQYACIYMRIYSDV